MLSPNRAVASRPADASVSPKSVLGRCRCFKGDRELLLAPIVCLSKQRKLWDRPEASGGGEGDVQACLRGGIGLWIGGGGCTRTELDDGGGVPTGETFLLTLVRRVNMNGRCWPPDCSVSALWISACRSSRSTHSGRSVRPASISFFASASWPSFQSASQARTNPS